MEHDPFPYKLDPPVVHIDRPGDDHLEVEDILKIEEAVEAEVRAFGGTFAGTSKIWPLRPYFPSIKAAKFSAFFRLGNLSNIRDIIRIFG